MRTLKIVRVFTGLMSLTLPNEVKPAVTRLQTTANIYYHKLAVINLNKNHTA